MFKSFGKPDFYALHAVQLRKSGNDYYDYFVCFIHTLNHLQYRLIFVHLSEWKLINHDELAGILKNTSIKNHLLLISMN